MRTPPTDNDTPFSVCEAHYLSEDTAELDRMYSGVYVEAKSVERLKVILEQMLQAVNNVVNGDEKLVLYYESTDHEPTQG